MMNDYSFIQIMKAQAERDMAINHAEEDFSKVEGNGWDKFQTVESLGNEHLTDLAWQDFAIMQRQQQRLLRQTKEAIIEKYKLAVKIARKGGLGYGSI